jgi:hypothetical protein
MFIANLSLLLLLSMPTLVAVLSMPTLVAVLSMPTVSTIRVYCMDSYLLYLAFVCTVW